MHYCGESTVNTDTQMLSCCWEGRGPNTGVASINQSRRCESRRCESKVVIGRCRRVPQCTLRRVLSVHTCFLVVKQFRNYSYGLGWFRNGGHAIYSSQSAKNLSLGFLRDGKLLFPPSLFCHFASQVTKRSSAKALDSLRHVVIGNEPLVSKAAAAAVRSIHCPKAAGKVLFSPSLR